MSNIDKKKNFHTVRQKCPKNSLRYQIWPKMKIYHNEDHKRPKNPLRYQICPKMKIHHTEGHKSQKNPLRFQICPKMKIHLTGDQKRPKIHFEGLFWSKTIFSQKSGLSNFLKCLANILHYTDPLFFTLKFSIINAFQAFDLPFVQKLF